MMKLFVIIIILLLLISTMGCIYVKHFTDTIDSAKKPIENLNIQSGVCDDNKYRNIPGVICPEKTPQLSLNITPTQSGI